VLDCHHEPDFGFTLVVQLPKKSRWKSHPRHMFDPRGLARRESALDRAPLGGLAGVAQASRKMKGPAT